MTSSIQCLSLESIDNGSAKSLIGDDGRIWATGYSSADLLLQAAYPAKREDYTHLRIGSQTWELDRIIDSNV